MTDLIKAADALAEAVNEQLSYRDLCGDKGDLERNMRNALVAYRQARESADGVRVKPLVWEGDFAHTSLGGYYHIEYGNEHALVLKFHAGSSQTGIAVKYDIPAIEAAAQADYESRIKAALDT